MIDGQELESSAISLRKSQSGNRKSKDVANGCPELKKARYNWQIKNKPSSGQNDEIHSTAKNLEALNEEEFLFDSCTSCCSHSTITDGLTNDATCLDMKLSHIIEGGSQSFSVEFEHTEAVRTNDNTAYADNGEVHDQQNKTEITDSNNGENVITHLQSCNNHVNACNSESTTSTSTHNHVVRSFNPSEPVRYVTMPMSKWLLEYSLMCAELDNDINKALERLRHMPDTNFTRQAYISERISLENAGIYQVIKQQGLKTSSWDISPLNCSTIRPYRRNSASFLDPVSTSTFLQDNTEPSSVHGYSLKTLVENKSNVIKTAASMEYSAGEKQATDSTTSQHLPTTTTSDAIVESVFTPAALSLAPSSTFIIDQAVSAVICERGIHL